MKRLLGLLLTAGFVTGVMAATAGSASAGQYGYGSGGGYSAPKKNYAPKKYYKPKKVYPVYRGSYDCYYEPTYQPPGGYVEGCYPPPDWIAYCSSKYNSFNADNGYYLGYDGYYHYCK